LLIRLHNNYGKKVVITENGAWSRDEVGTDGQVNDDARIKYISEHLAAAHKAIKIGVDLGGYFVWSFLDDYEWNRFGRMGLVYVDFDTQKRIIKKSGYRYKEIVRNAAAGLPIQKL